jgi:hypothetical protein
LVADAGYESRTKFKKISVLGVANAIGSRWREACGGVR